MLAPNRCERRGKINRARFQFFLLCTTEIVIKVVAVLLTIAGQLHGLLLAFPVTIDHRHCAPTSLCWNLYEQFWRFE